MSELRQWPFPKLSEGSGFFFPKKQITRTRHVSARVCFVRLGLKLTDQVVSAGAELGALVLHTAAFVFLVRKLTQSVLE